MINLLNLTPLIWGSFGVDLFCAIQAQNEATEKLSLRWLGYVPAVIATLMQLVERERNNTCQLATNCTMLTLLKTLIKERRTN
tara:strand:- start:92 stop:340 length:249 start_codon:yes stop_codon:yes gene_type:complete